MLCPSCHRRLDPGAASCDRCGAATGRGGASLELVLSDATRVPIVDELTIGRSPESGVRLEDPSVSRVHAHISGGGDGGPVIEDAGSRYGTWLDGVRLTRPMPLHDGARIRMGDQELMVERRRDAAEAGRTKVVQIGASLAVPAAAAGLGVPGLEAGSRPRVRSGYALKRLKADEGPKRWVLKDLRSGAFLRLSDHDAELFELLDGRRVLADLVEEAQRRFGPAGAARLARLLADLGSRGFLHGTAAAPVAPEEAGGRLRGLLRPRERAFPVVGRAFEGAFRNGGWALFTRPGLVAVGILATAGVAVFAYLVAAEYGTPFVVAEKIGWGALVFLLGRFAVVAVHELAHGLAMASVGRPIERAGLKLVLVFPYAFVDTSPAWFEPRRRRIAISAAGPVADLALGALFAAACLLAAEGTVRDVLFQLALAAYVGALFNLNPLLERDGYHMLVDVLGEPGLRRRAKEQFARRLSGRGAADESPVLARYALAGLVWSVVAAALVIALSLRYASVMTDYVPEALVWCMLAALWLAVLVPVVVVVGPPLVQRARGEAA